MLTLVQEFNKKMASTFNPVIEEFGVGDTINVGLKIVDGNNSRIQEFHGVCIAKRNKSIGSNIIVRKISDDVEVERNVALYSPALAYIKVISKGKVRRAKLYYLKGRRGKSARIKAVKKF
jgi:large subunit ribosomal protein L19